MKDDLTAIPGNAEAILQVREECRRMVRNRAAVSAGVSALPVPGLDVMSDLTMLTGMVNDVNAAFGLTAEQVEHLQPAYRRIVFGAAAGLGGMMVGKLVTRQLAVRLLKRSSLKSFARSAARFVPLAGQVASAAIGFAVFRKLGYDHVDACATVAQELLAARAG
ncbi:hypothetical protein F2P45_14190 [Massilia sp. CCM 8733]|uniref:DUF697 domain-containing protein n=1 Tax=Massilia mucilaginosa TaxID=2609282 RepID=A0ABX0NTF0_9BURK|nr:hypothetical protein [Massilia mucilaginosa]NHZ90158.1 hypothetical protein [Massilia mucilaginosa]